MSVIYGNPIIVGGGGLELVCNVDTGSTVTATLGSQTVTGVSVDGQIRLKIPKEGKWTVSAVNGLMVSVPQQISVPATLDIPLVAQELNDTSWAAIKQVADASMGTNFWSAGDCKQITMNGKVSDGLTLSGYSTWVYIIGFDHNSSREGTGIAFQGFKATKNGTPVCLVDSGCDNQCSSGWFCMNGALASGSATNAGGWSSCGMRQSIMPLIKAAFPSDLQAVIKTSTIYTDNAGGTPQTLPELTATQDDVYLLAEYEIFGARSYANNREVNYLKQYAYYAAGNSKVKYRHNATGSAAFWWERSPNSGNSSTFCNVTTSGSATAAYAYWSRGVAPAFKI